MNAAGQESLGWAVLEPRAGMMGDCWHRKAQSMAVLHEAAVCIAVTLALAEML